MHRSDCGKSGYSKQAAYVVLIRASVNEQRIVPYLEWAAAMAKIKDGSYRRPISFHGLRVLFNR